MQTIDRSLTTRGKEEALAIRKQREQIRDKQRAWHHELLRAKHESESVGQFRSYLGQEMARFQSERLGEIQLRIRQLKSFKVSRPIIPPLTTAHNPLDVSRGSLSNVWAMTTWGLNFQPSIVLLKLFAREPSEEPRKTDWTRRAQRSSSRSFNGLRRTFRSFSKHRGYSLFCVSTT